MPNIHYVKSNLLSGTIEAIKYLVDKGHRQIGLINGPRALLASRERCDGYFRGLTTKKLKIDTTLIVDCDLSPAGIIRALDILLYRKRRPTAIITFNDDIALSGMEYANSLGIRINEEIEFFSFSNLPLMDYIGNGQ